MSDDWYYANGNEVIGPVTLTAIQKIAASLNDSSLLVWRDGFQDWKKATDVPELVVKRPPPLPSAEPSPELLAEKTKKLTLLKECLRTVESAPVLRRFNGIGCTILGSYSDPDLRSTFFAVYAFTFLWIPIFPIRIYLASGSNPYQFYGSISFSDFGRVYPGKTQRLLGSAFLHSLAMMAVVVALIFALATLKYYFRKFR